ncbi:uncharacterized protein LOC132558893 [Ylistrum balloti]|uniref:uncharacterized protein LOC132558893 n=1 Tax=Ylistrum balloti TaxID=509963 RepID=UPI0029059114|nr:uncharacterized protein LOC132558893 [Ylistrum balloti]
MVCPVGNKIIIAISVNFILQLAGLCLPNWVTSQSGGEYGGLFAYCVGPTCDSLPLIFHMGNADYGGVVSLHLVGTGLLLVTIFVGSILAWRSGWTKVTFLVMSGFLFTAVIHDSIRTMAETTAVGVYWYLSFLPILVIQIASLVTPCWYQVSWVQEGIIRQQHAGLFTAFNGADYLVICAGMDTCKDFDPSASCKLNNDIAKTLLMAGSVLLLLGFVVSAPGCSKTNRGNNLILTRICGYTAFLTLTGCLWIYIAFHCDTYQIRGSFISLQLGHCFYLTVLTGCVSLIMTFCFGLASMKDIPVTHHNLHDDVITKENRTLSKFLPDL